MEKAKEKQLLYFTFFSDTNGESTKKHMTIHSSYLQIHVEEFDSFSIEQLFILPKGTIHTNTMMM